VNWACWAIPPAAVPGQAPAELLGQGNDPLGEGAPDLAGRVALGQGDQDEEAGLALDHGADRGAVVGVTSPSQCPGMAAWQRCRVHATRNALGLVAKAAQGMVASAIRSIFEQPDEASARAQLRRVADGLQPRFPKVAELLERAEDDLLAHFTFPPAHRRQIRSTNPQERLNKEIRRRTDVVGIFPNRRCLLRLVGMLLAEQDDEWAVGRNYFSAESMALIDAPRPTEEVPPGLLIAS